MACLYLVEEVSVFGLKQLLSSRRLTPKVVIQGDISPRHQVLPIRRPPT